MEKHALACKVEMRYSKATKPAKVHLSASNKDSDWGLGAHCSAKVSKQNAHSLSAWEASRNLGDMEFCKNCRKFWPQKLAEALEL
jgi:hypothetical protein